MGAVTGESFSICSRIKPRPGEFISTCIRDLEQHHLQEALLDLSTHPVSLLFVLTEPGSFAAEKWPHFANLTHSSDLLNVFASHWTVTSMGTGTLCDRQTHRRC